MEGEGTRSGGLPPGSDGSDPRWRDAHTLFLKYDGSTSSMWREGSIDEYQAFEVPDEVERIWLDELTASKLRLLDTVGNWQVISFLSHHSKFDHLADLIEAEPLGEPWERRAFVGDLLRYTDLCAARGEPQENVRRALHRVIEEGRKLRNAPPPGSAARIVQEARERLASSGDSSVRWRWLRLRGG